MPGGRYKRNSPEVVTLVLRWLLRVSGEGRFVSEDGVYKSPDF